MTDATSETPEALAPEQQAMSSDEAIAALTQASEQEDQPAAQPEDAPDPETVTEGEEQDADPETAIDAPSSWDAEAKAKWAELPRDVQEIVLAREADRDRAASKAVSEAGQAKKQAEQEAAQIAALRSQIDDVLPKALQTFKSKWDGINWAEEAQKDPVRAFQAKQVMEAEREQLDQLQAAQQQAQAVEHQNHVRTVLAELPTIAPDLVDPKEGQARVSALSKFLIGEEGISQEALKWASARELALAYDAMRYRALQAQAKTALTAKPPALKSVKPTGTQQASSDPASTLSRRFAQTGKADDAVALILAKGL